MAQGAGWKWLLLCTPKFLLLDSFPRRPETFILVNWHTSTLRFKLHRSTNGYYIWGFFFALTSVYETIRKLGRGQCRRKMTDP